MMGHKDKLKTGSEYDLVSRWRKDGVIGNQDWTYWKKCINKRSRRGIREKLKGLLLGKVDEENLCD